MIGCLIDHFNFHFWYCYDFHRNKTKPWHISILKNVWFLWDRNNDQQNWIKVELYVWCWNLSSDNRENDKSNLTRTVQNSKSRKWQIPKLTRPVQNSKFKIEKMANVQTNTTSLELWKWQITSSSNKRTRWSDKRKCRGVGP